MHAGGTDFGGIDDVLDVDIAIVGAGISGLYCALRLIEGDPSRRIAVVERLDRTGGRLDSDLIEIRPGEIVREEEGGMRFNYEMQELMRLIHHLGLCDEIVPFPMASDVGEIGNTNRFHVRGHTFTAAEGAAGTKGIWSTLYDLNADEQNLSPTDIVTNAYRAVLTENGATQPTHQTPEYWTEFRETYTWDGEPMNHWQMWGLLRAMGRSEGCVQMLTETIGFEGPFRAPINAGDAFQILADFPVDPHYYTFRRGFSTLPDTVAKRLADHVQIMLSTNVDRVDRDGEQFALTLTAAPDDNNSNPHIAGGETKRINADHLVVAVATAGMERLFVTSPALNAHADAQRLLSAIRSARGMKLMKINLYFDQPWWQNGSLVDPPVQFGPNFTNLPINAVYPFYSLDPERGAGSLSPDESIPDGAAALTIYCDFDNTNFWSGLQGVGEMFSSRFQEQQNAKRPRTVYPASKKVVAEARRQIATLFAIDEVPEPLLTSYRLWDGTDDFEYAYHQWRHGVVDSEVRRYLANPFDGVSFCNEAISDMHGWVNGSLRSTDDALRHFGLEPLDGPLCTPPSHADGHAPAALPITGPWGV